ncbi:hypothetical protein H6G59_11150 [Anabaena lutea FACHB-196]|uniref:Transposase n=1 Tax=Anabaena lutea FACHB-196 TaxID=2692881 RepID=A0ABR8FHR5_9NOST|nr:hypothetical protein [Anabaena lutea FACHB-196]
MAKASQRANLKDTLQIMTYLLGFSITLKKDSQSVNTVGVYPIADEICIWNSLGLD